jgi:sugar phosphate permease
MSQALPLSREQRAWQGKILVATFMAYAGYYLVRKVFSICKSTLAKPIEEGGYGMGYEDVANIWTAFLVAYMVGQFANSYLGRKWGPRVLLLGGLAASMACNVIFGFANSYTTFLVFMAFNGLVQASGWPAAVGGVAEWLRPKERGAIMGFWSSSYIVGNLVVKFAAGTLLLHYGVPYAFWGCTLLTFVIWWVVYFWQRDRPEDVGLAPIVDMQQNEAGEAVAASESLQISFADYLKLALNPLILLMGVAYFCLKFLRYMLDSWLPAFLDLQGLDVAKAAQYSTFFDIAGLAGAVLAGLAMDRLFRGRWDKLCLVLAVGMVLGYVCVIMAGTNLFVQALCFGLVGLMLYGPDTIMCGAAAVVVAGERNAVAVAGLVNGIGSIGPIVQEQVIGRLLSDSGETAAIRDSNFLGLGISVVYLLLMVLIVVVMQISLRKRSA